MKTMLLFILITCLSCTTHKNKYEQEIVNFIQVKDGVKTELDIKFTEIAIRNFTVGDSIKVLQEHFEKEKAEKINNAQSSVKHYETSIEKQQKKGDNLVAKALISSFTKKLEAAKKELDIANNLHPDYLSRYAHQETDKVLVQVVNCRFSLLNPKLNIRQEGPGSFLFSSDGSKLLRAITVIQK